MLGQVVAVCSRPNMNRVCKEEKFIMNIIRRRLNGRNRHEYWIRDGAHHIGPFYNPAEASAALLRHRKMNISVEDQINKTYCIKIGESRFGEFTSKHIAYQNINRIFLYPVEILSYPPRENTDTLWDIRVGCGYIGPFDSSEEAWRWFQAILEQQIKIEVHDVGAANEKWTLLYGKNERDFDTEKALLEFVCRILGLDVNNNVTTHPSI